MAIYKDYGTPPTTNQTSYLAGAVGPVTQRGNVTVLNGTEGQYRGGDALPALAITNKETPTKWEIQPSDSLGLGDMDIALAVAVTDGEDELRLLIESNDQSTDLIELDWDGATLSLNGSVTGTVFEAASSPTGATNIAFSADADGNLIVNAGASVPADTLVVVRRIEWS